MIGDTLSHYRIVDRLGSGGMGEVYLADDVRLERSVALKMLPQRLARDPSRIERFRREARALARLNHPHIVTVYAVECVDGLDFLVMEYVVGKTLSQFVPRSGLGMIQFFSIAVPLADALAAAHGAGIVHRDLKPANIMITESAEPKILDFGIAKLSDSTATALDTQLATEALTDDHQLLGTAPYMAPEQLQGRTVDERSDIFSLGIVLYQMATGRRPFPGDTSAEVVSAILRDQPPAADQVRGELPHHLGRILGHCLEKDPEQRLQSAKDLRNELGHLQRELTAEGTAGAAPRQSPRPLRGRWSARRLGILAGLPLAALAIWLLWQRPPSFERSAPLAPAARQLLDEGSLRERRGHTRENLEAAEERYRRALALEPESGAILARLAAVLSRIQIQYPDETLAPEIRQLAARALQRGGEASLPHVALGRVLLLEGDLAGAEREARLAIRAAPADHEGHGLLGQVLIDQDRVDEGLAALGRALEAAGSDVRGRLTLANALMGLGRNDEAAAEYVKIRQSDPDYPDALNNLAVIYTRTGRDLDAIPLFKRLLDLDREDEYAAQGLGVIYFNLGRFGEAVGAFETSHRINPAKPTAPHALGETHEKLRDTAAARRWYATAVAAYDAAIGAGGARSYNLALRAFCVAKLGRFEEAKENIREALELDPDDGYRLFNAAQVYALADERDEAFRHVARSLQAGYARQEFLRDSAFAGFRDDPEFLELLEVEPG